MTNAYNNNTAAVQSELATVSSWHRPACEGHADEWAYTESYVLRRAGDGTIVAYNRPAKPDERGHWNYTPRTGRRVCTIRG